MSFYLKFDARTVQPIKEFTSEMRAEWYKTCCENLCYEEAVALHNARVEHEKQKHQKFLTDLHNYFVKAVGADPDRAMTVAQAKHYVRLRASESLRAAFETFENVLRKGSNAPLKDQLDVSYEIMKRAVGPATALSTMPDVRGQTALTDLAPVEGVDRVLKAYANGEVDADFVKTTLGLLGAKINGLRIEQESDRKSTKKVTDKIQKPPSGKVV